MSYSDNYNGYILHNKDFMKVYERSFAIPVTTNHKNLISYLKNYITCQLADNEIPIRFVVNTTNTDTYYCDVGIIALDDKSKYPNLQSIFDFNLRTHENTNEFNIVLIVPTGVHAEIGGHSGDAGTISKLFGSVCDNFITHPNVVNAADINEMPANTLYVEGSSLCKLLMGSIGLQKVRSNRVLFVLDKHEQHKFNVISINSLNAARATYGLNCPKIVFLSPSVELTSEYTKEGRAIGRINNLERMCAAFEKYKGEYDAVAINTIIDIDLETEKKYFELGSEVINPWGGVEAMLTHSLATLYNVPTAHSPMCGVDKEIGILEVDVVDPRKAAESVSLSALQCIFKGLQNSPKLVANDDMHQEGTITATNISCLITPDGCVGLPILAALEQGITVIAVKSNANIMKNDLQKLPWKPGQFYLVESYLEAVGIVTAIKAGITVESIQRPIELTPIETMAFNDS